MRKDDKPITWEENVDINYLIARGYQNTLQLQLATTDLQITNAQAATQERQISMLVKSRYCDWRRAHALEIT
jgi:hypothetical protein